MRKPLLAANWKMNQTVEESLGWLAEFAQVGADVINRDLNDTEADVVFCPPFTALYPLHTAIAQGSVNIGLGAQDVFWQTAGAFTGEISPGMLTECGVGYVICGHSERRTLLQESSEMVSKKCGAALAAGMTPILCVGESESIHEGGLTAEWLEAQLYESMRFWDGKADIVIAYEPIWAIGTGKAATADEAQMACKVIREYLREQAGDVADSIRILYGGSVSPQNVASFMAAPDVDGALVGGASLKAATFAELCREAFVGVNIK